MAIFPDRGHLLQVGQDVFHHARPDIVPHSARRHIDHADRGLSEIQFRHLAKLVGKLRAADDGMEKRRVDGVHGVFQDLSQLHG